ncbi:MAG: DUF4143 domain-containing protein, partial [Micrococcales bacterium]|nr:DUF4143 domain-containing protein [Micrococcales bacterium]
LKGLARSPRHHLADPALAAHLLGATAASLARSPNPDQPIRPRQGTLFGALFESLAVLCVKVYAAPLKGEVSYLRTKRGEHEVDLIVQRPDGAIAAFEVKSSAEVTSSDVRHLLWLKDRFRSRLVDLAVINTGTACFRRRDGVGVIPLALLGP